MEYIQKIESAVTADSLTLYWEKPSGDGSDKVKYRIYLNAIEECETVKTHVTLERLQPDTSYKVSVEACRLDMSGGVGEVLWAVSLHLCTASMKRRLDVTQAPYFAKGDGVTMDTSAIQQAFSDCTSSDTVYFPEGVYLTGALRLHSDMDVYLEEGAVLQGTADPKDYTPRIPSRFEGIEMECYSSLLNLGDLDHKGPANCRNVLLYGKGTITSGGRPLAEAVIHSERERRKDDLAKMGDKIKECENADTIPGRVRPRLINMSNCSNIRLSGLTLSNGASWNVHMIYSDHILTDHCIFRSENVWNGDGWDPDSSEYCTIFGCTFYTGDDSVAIKSGKNPEGNVINRPARHIRIFDCECKAGNGITIGSEMSGGVKDVKIWDCDVSNGYYGIEIKGTKKRGGFVRDVHVMDCILPRILFHSVGYNDDGEGAPVPPLFGDCSFRNIYLLGRCCDHKGVYHDCVSIELCGFDVSGYEIKNLEFQNIVMENGGGEISAKYCKNVVFSLQ